MLMFLIINYTNMNQSQSRKQTNLDAVVIPNVRPHHHRSRMNTAADVQQGETETLAKRFTGFTGETGAAPEDPATFRIRTRITRHRSQIWQNTKYINSVY